MQKKVISALCSVGLLFVSQSTMATENDQQQLKQEAISIVQKFGGTLKPQLQDAMKGAGPIHAISVCSVAAPAIAQKLSKDTGWTVNRVSLKARNNKTAIPDAWEKKVLEQFDQRQAAGESAEKMAFAEIVDGKYRFMKAQGVEKVCLNCHAAEIKPEVEAALKQHYPEDMARGYSEGQIRGAFSVSKEVF